MKCGVAGRADTTFGGLSGKRLTATSCDQVENRAGLTAVCVQSAQEPSVLLELESEKASLERELNQLKMLYEQLWRGTQEAEAEAMLTAERCSELE